MRNKCVAIVFQCGDCERNVAIYPTNFLSSGRFSDWFMVKDRVWQRSQRKSGHCLLLVGCPLCAKSRRGRLGALRSDKFQNCSGC
jgi:hypothetical protein